MSRTPISPPHSGPRPSATQPPLAGAVSRPIFLPATILRVLLLPKPPSTPRCTASTPLLQATLSFQFPSRLTYCGKVLSFFHNLVPGISLRGGPSNLSGPTHSPHTRSMIGGGQHPHALPEAGRRRGSRPEVPAGGGREESRSVKDSIRSGQGGEAGVSARSCPGNFAWIPPAVWPSRRRGNCPMSEGLVPAALSSPPPPSPSAQSWSFASEINALLGEPVFLGSVLSAAPCEPIPQLTFFQIYGSN